MRMQPAHGRGVAAALAAVLTWSAVLAAEPPVLSLSEAIEQALAQNPTQSSRRLEVERAAEEQDVARGGRWPTVDLKSSATRYGYPSLVVPIREIGVFPPLDDTIYDIGVALALPLYTGGRIAQGVVVADLGKEIAVETERLGRQELTFNVSSVYLKILHLGELDQAYAARIASLEAQERRVQLLVKVGKAPRLDLLKTQVLLTKARHDRLKIRHSRQEAYTLLYNLLGSERPRTETPLVAYAAGTEPAWTLEALKRAAHAQRPEIRISGDQLATREAQVEIARAARRPDVALVGAYRERAGSDTEFLDDWSVGVQLSLPLFDGGVRASRVQQAALGREQAAQAAEQTRLDVDKQVEDAWNRHREALSRLDVTARSVQEAEEALAIERLRYEQGVGLVTDLLGAETSLLTAQADRLQAEFDLIVARVEVLRASGQASAEQVLALVAARPDTATERPVP